MAIGGLDWFTHRYRWRQAKLSRSGGFIDLAGHRIDQLQHQQIIAKKLVADQLDIAVDLLYGVQVIAGEVTGYAEQAGAGPLDAIGHLFPQHLHHQPAVLGLMVEQPIQIEKALIDDIFVTVTFVLDDHRAAILIDPEGIDPPLVGLALRDPLIFLEDSCTLIEDVNICSLVKKPNHATGRIKPDFLSFYASLYLSVKKKRAFLESAPRLAHMRG